MNQSQKVAVGLVIAALLAGISYYYWQMRPAGPFWQEQGCTTEAKICPDGSAVGRSGPNCEFAACPGEESGNTAIDTDGWAATTTAQGIIFKYPADLASAEYVHPNDWPPTLDVREGVVACEVSGSEITGGVMTERRLVNGHDYCVTREGEGAAGSIYTTYTYTTQRDGQVATLSFVIRTVQCLNYDEPQRSVCQAAQAGFDVNRLADGIFSTVVIP